MEICCNRVSTSLGFARRPCHSLPQLLQKHLVQDSCLYNELISNFSVDLMPFSAAAFAEAPWCILPPKALPPHPSRALLTRQPLELSEIANRPIQFSSPVDVNTLPVDCQNIEEKCMHTTFHFLSV